MIKKNPQKNIKYKKYINSFFDCLRVRYDIYAFQNEQEVKYDFLKKSYIKYIVSLGSKNAIFDEAGNQVSNYTIYYGNLTDEDLRIVKLEALNYLKEVFFIAIRKDSDKKGFGKIVLKDIKEKGEIDNGR